MPVRRWSVNQTAGENPKSKNVWLPTLIFYSSLHAVTNSCTAGLSPDARVPESVRTEDIATPASPHEIVLGGVLLVAVNVAHFNRARSATKGADWDSPAGADPPAA